MSDCAKCHRESVVRDQEIAQRVDVWTTARQLLRTVTPEDEHPAPDDVLALYVILSGTPIVGNAE